ncbi:cardiolipin synthase (CMP-forming)-like [Mya arenaria]|uniref:cardiolipin synthase (CMP-forming)-like n=1 Tax=Mya arenaria TaxID=6604 RepID=UPI0022E5C0E4|nr:cardiolipin synthase (CMP-forming)-like [Mya arenaria]
MRFPIMICRYNIKVLPNISRIYLGDDNSYFKQYLTYRGHRKLTELTAVKFIHGDAIVRRPRNKDAKNNGLCVIWKRGGLFYNTNGHCLSTECSRNFSSNALPSNNSKKSTKENIYTIPNAITVTRMAVTPVIGYLIIQQSFSWALGIFIVAAISDSLDGYIARNFKNQSSTLGSALDPLADKILVNTITISLTVANLLPLPLAVLIISRDVLLILAGLVIRYTTLQKPRTLKDYLDLSNVTAKLEPSTLSKRNTFFQLSLLSLTMASPVFDFIDHPVIQALWYLTAITTVGTGVDYAINRNKYIKFPKQPPAK